MPTRLILTLVLIVVIVTCILFTPKSKDEQTDSPNAQQKPAQLTAKPTSIPRPQWKETALMPATTEPPVWTEFSLAELTAIVKSGDKRQYRTLKHSFEQAYGEDKSVALALLDQLLTSMAEDQQYEDTLSFLSYLDSTEEIPDRERPLYLSWLSDTPEAVWETLAQWQTAGSFKPVHQFALLSSIYQNERQDELASLLSWVDTTDGDGFLAQLAPTLGQQVTAQSQQQIQSFLAERFQHENVRIGALELAQYCPLETLPDALEWGNQLPTGTADAAQFLEIGIRRLTKSAPDLAVELINDPEFINSYSGDEAYLAFSDQAITTYIREIVYLDPHNAQLALEGLSSPALKAEYGTMVDNVLRRLPTPTKN